MMVLSQGKREHFRCRGFGIVGFCIRGSLVVGVGWWSVAADGHATSQCQGFKVAIRPSCHKSRVVECLCALVDSLYKFVYIKYHRDEATHGHRTHP